MLSKVLNLKIQKKILKRKKNWKKITDLMIHQIALNSGVGKIFFFKKIIFRKIGMIFDFFHLLKVSFIIFVKVLLSIFVHWSNYRTRSIISRDLYFFLPIFHWDCGLYCRAAIISLFFFLHKFYLECFFFRFSNRRKSKIHKVSL